MKKIITFGELLARFSTIDSDRIKQSNHLKVDFGGAEANVASSLAQFGEKVDFISRVPKNDLTEKALMSLKQFGVNTENILFGGDRLGLYFYEKGEVYRSSKVIYDRSHSSMATIKKDAINWDVIFKDADWFHWTGITPALSKACADTTFIALQKAKERGIKISGDYNLRKNLWNWGKSHTEIMPELLQFCDIMSGIHPNIDITKQDATKHDFKKAGDEMLEKYPNCKLIVFTSRGSYSASHNTWSGTIYDGKNVYTSFKYDITHMIDRVGGGDSFMAALIYALRNYEDLQYVVEFAAAASTLKHLTKGDTNICTVQEVEELIQNKSGLIQR
ncbi:sugar kinase [Flammeovirga yaeyamensis]|uniref:Sugar kinase n=1 Tax=Flammeovirga yaeyamensis TaxID=367791 RepID=A0AAX1N2V4_9BACT|nr:sugar kinase [Flammeovirga yaeyamensis]MBB3700773.1 2-dehydro-3-deoxygluconokinase [Flammeovirga yaeyamensis]NMF37871.1 sugar kinase [Flammeovirga yaeyamensis]QWG01767.1 sugar kinase [Flammeovirga yaeyamensis]